MATKASRPWLLKPRRLTRALAAGMRNMRGCGLPGWGLGVTVPTSTKPNPMAASASMQRAFLSRPAAMPTRLGNFSPASSIGSDTMVCDQAHCSGVPCPRASRFMVRSWAASASRQNRKGRARA
ncbi:hypothetical protein D3C80_1466780 [compost metagenome]